MQKHIKELILNTTVVSLLLTLSISWIIIETRTSLEPPAGDKDAIFLLLFLVLFPYHIMVSFLQFGIGRMIGSLPLRLIVFNAAGVTLALLLWLTVKDDTAPAALLAFGVISLIHIAVHAKTDHLL